MYWECVVDGASRGQGQRKMGEGACAVVIYKNKKEYAKYARPLGKCTNNQAEYEALITCLLICSMDPNIKDPVIYSDSAVVVNQVNNKWICRHDTLMPLLLAVRIIQEQFRFRLVQVPRNLVHEADTMCGAVLDRLAKEKLELQKPGA